MKKYLYLLALSCQLLTLATLSSCSWFGGSDDDEKVKAEEVKRPVEDIYEEAQNFMDGGRYAKAIAQYQEVERLYPFSPLATKSRVMEAYAQYKDEELDKAIDVVDEFVTLNPGNEEVEFMYYLKAICYYDRISDVKRDQDITIKAQAAFKELINRFPSGKYARDSQYKLDLIEDHLAAKEMEVGRFYSHQKNYLAAINRYKTVVKDYDNTEQIEEALYRLTEANALLGLDQEAVKYATVLGYNYPSSKWYKRSYKIVNGIKENGGKTFVGKVLDSFGLGSEPSSSEPAALQSSPNLVDTGGWITDDSSIQQDQAAPAEATPTTDANHPAPEAENISGDTNSVPAAPDADSKVPASMKKKAAEKTAEEKAKKPVEKIKKVLKDNVEAPKEVAPTPQSEGGAQINEEPSEDETGVNKINTESESQ